MTSRLPLEAARAFLFAAESGSFAGAAERLQLSAGAISQRIQALEAFVGETLFDRAAAGTRLTEAGRHLYDELREPLHAVESALTRPRATSGSARRVSVSAAPGFAARWLMPRLSDFSRRHPDVAVDLNADPRQVRFDGPVPDLALRYGPPQDDGLARVELFRPRTLICVRPDLLPRKPAELRPQDLADLPLLGHGHRGQWRHWLTTQGLAESSMHWGPVYSDDILLREAVLAGQGAALARELFVRDDIDRGTLAQLFDAWLPEERYWLVGPPRVFERSAPALFRDWLLDVVAADHE